MAVTNPPGIEKLVQYPQFDSIEEKRHNLKKVLAGSYRIFGKFGFSEGVAGHITCRDPEHTDCFWVNPFGVSFRRMKMSDLIKYCQKPHSALSILPVGGKMSIS